MTYLIKPLTKYPFIKARDCIKALYLHYHWPGLQGPSDANEALQFSIGNKVGKAGQQLYPGGVDLTEDGKIRGKSLLQKTNEALISNKTTFYEALFITPCKQFSCRVDILHRESNENIIVEVKSSTSISYPEHLLDVGFQYMILKQVLIGKPLKFFIVHLNKEYEKESKLEINKLFTVIDMTEQAKSVQPIIEKYINIYSDMLKDKLPFENSVGPHCIKPHKCPFYDYCWKDIPEYSVFNISRLKKAKAQELLESGIVTPEQIPKKFKLSERQQIEIDCSIKNMHHIDKSKLSNFIDNLEVDKSMYFMDFETLAPPIPLYEGMRCYQHVCFQYSLLKKSNSDQWQRIEFLAKPGKDPRLNFTESLLRATQDTGKIVVYNKAFEISRLRELAIQFPKYKIEIDERISRIVDLMHPFMEHYYYHPKFQGNFSLKKILPVLCPDYKGYSELIIKDGISAMREYENLGELPLMEQVQSRRALKEYCFTDTMAMVKILQFLTKQCKI